MLELPMGITSAYSATQPPSRIRSSLHASSSQHAEPFKESSCHFGGRMGEKYGKYVFDMVWRCFKKYMFESAFTHTISYHHVPSIYRTCIPSWFLPSMAWFLWNCSPKGSHLHHVVGVSIWIEVAPRCQKKRHSAAVTHIRELTLPKISETNKL